MFNKPDILNDGFQPPGAQMIGQGKTLVKAEAGYQTAITVQKPRNLTRIEQAVLAEAEFATDDFFYQWIVTNRDGKREVIQGGTISLALCMAREWTNSVVKVDVEEKEGSWCFKGSFIDLERGSTVERLFRKSIPKTAPGKYEGDRWVDMVFQKAQSQALRNVIFSSLPRWLKERAVEKARDAALRNIETYGVEKAKEMILLPMVKLGVTTSQVETYLGKTRNEWDKEDLLLLRNVVVQIRNGDATLEEVFSSGKTPKANPGPKAAPTGSRKSNQFGSSPAKTTTQSQPQPTTQSPNQAAMSSEQQTQPSTSPAAVSGKGDRLKDLYTKLFRLGLKDLLEPYKLYLKEKYAVGLPEALTVDQIAEQEKILETCRAKFDRLKEFKALLQGKNGSTSQQSASTRTNPPSNGSRDNQPPTEEPQPVPQTDPSTSSDPKEFSLF